jgi:hypothetical protein
VWACSTFAEGGRSAQCEQETGLWVLSNYYLLLVVSAADISRTVGCVDTWLITSIVVEQCGLVLHVSTLLTYLVRGSLAKAQSV